MVLEASAPRARERRLFAVVPPRYALSSAVLLLLVITERWLLSLHTFPGDRWAAQLGMSHKPWVVWAITRVYQQVGRPLVAIAEVALILAWLWRGAGRREIHGLVIALLASVSCGLIKIICGPTPLWKVLPHHVGTNFPSGVVTFMTATVGYVAMVMWRQGHRTRAVLLIAAITGAGAARVVGGQHLISDVLGAYMLGGAWLLLARAHLTAPDRVPGAGVRGHRRLDRRAGTEHDPGSDTDQADAGWKLRPGELEAEAGVGIEPARA